MILYHLNPNSAGLLNEFWGRMSHTSRSPINTVKKQKNNFLKVHNEVGKASPIFSWRNSWLKKVWYAKS